LMKGQVVEVSSEAARPKVSDDECICEKTGQFEVGDAVLFVSSGTIGGEQKVLWMRDSNSSLELAAALKHRLPLVVRFRRPDQRVLEDKLKKKRAWEELMSLRALSTESTNCPRCKVRISRIAGCNHMKCTKCGAHFCYRCGSNIPASDPYSHFTSGRCHTFGGEHVQTTSLPKNLSNESELQVLRRVFAEKEDLVAQFEEREQHHASQHRQSGQHGRVKKDLVNGSFCPSCRQYNDRLNRLNHVRCHACRTSFCHHCKLRIVGIVTLHYRGEKACPQHG